MAALAARGHRVGADPLAEFDHGDEAVAVIAVPALGPRSRQRAEGRERPVTALAERHRDAGRGIAIGWLDRRGDALEAVDLAPRHLPPTEVALELSERLIEHLKLQAGRRVACEAHHDL